MEYLLSYTGVVPRRPSPDFFNVSLPINASLPSTPSTIVVPSPDDITAIKNTRMDSPPREHAGWYAYMGSSQNQGQSLLFFHYFGSPLPSDAYLPSRIDITIAVSLGDKNSGPSLEIRLNGRSQMIIFYRERLDEVSDSVLPLLRVTRLLGLATHLRKWTLIQQLKSAGDVDTKIRSLTREELGLFPGIVNEMRKLFSTFSTILAALEDAEQKPLQIKAIQIRLRKLRNFYELIASLSEGCQPKSKVQSSGPLMKKSLLLERKHGRNESLVNSEDQQHFGCEDLDDAESSGCFEDLDQDKMDSKYKKGFITMVPLLQLIESELLSLLEHGDRHYGGNVFCGVLSYIAISNSEKKNTIGTLGKKRGRNESLDDAKSFGLLGVTLTEQRNIIMELVAKSNCFSISALEGLLQVKPTTENFQPTRSPPHHEAKSSGGEQTQLDLSEQVPFAEYGATNYGQAEIRNQMLGRISIIEEFLDDQIQILSTEENSLVSPASLDLEVLSSSILAPTQPTLVAEETMIQPSPCLTISTAQDNLAQPTRSPPHHEAESSGGEQMQPVLSEQGALAEFGATNYGQAEEDSLGSLATEERMTESLPHLTESTAQDNHAQLATPTLQLETFPNVGFDATSIGRNDVNACKSGTAGITKNDLIPLVGFPREKAAREIRYGKRQFQRICRIHGIESWPDHLDKNACSLIRQKLENDFARGGVEAWDHLAISEHRRIVGSNRHNLPCSKPPKTQREKKTLPICNTPSTVATCSDPTPKQGVTTKSCPGPQNRAGLDFPSTSSPKCLHHVFRTRTMKTSSYVDLFPAGLQTYIRHVNDVKADGNCGFRAIAGLMGFGEDGFMQVKKDLLIELHAHKDHYMQLFGSQERIDELTHILAYLEANPEYDRWMTMPDMGHLISSFYNVVLYFLSLKQCLTFLPLRTIPIETRKEICLGYVNDNHFIQVFLMPGHPVPPIVTNWRRYHQPCAAGWDTAYMSRIQHFKEVVDSDVAIVETVELD